MDRNTKYYQDFFKLYTLANPAKTSKACQVEVNEIWNNTIKDGKKKVNTEAYENESNKLRAKLKKKENSVASFFKKHDNVLAKTKDTEDDTNVEKQQPPVEEDDRDYSAATDEDDTPTTNPLRHHKETPAQDKLKEDIAKVEKVITNLTESRNLGFNEGSAAEITKHIKEAKRKKEDLERTLRRKLTDQKATNKFRAKKREGESLIKENYPELAAALKIRDNVGRGRPRIECDQPNILSDILQIATIGAACGDKRREDMYRTAKTLDDLHGHITSLGYRVSRSGLYLRLEPRNQNTSQGKKHVQTLPVKLVRPQNNLRKGHSDRMFAAESFKAVDKIAEFIGPEACLYSSQDDKSSVPLGVIAAKKQSTILMSVRARVRLPDHDFKVGSKHLLVPSVIAICQIDPKTGVTYTGNTYIAVRSAKHNGSTAFSHAEDLARFCELQPSLFKLPGSVNEFKPVIVKGVDGGPDENPRFHNNINMGCKIMTDFNLDCYIEVTNAPGLSAYNRAERRMYHLSKQLTGVVLPYDTFGSHIVNGKTVDDSLELKNFEAAGEILAEIWSNMVIDNFPVQAEFINTPVTQLTKDFQPTPEFRARHVFETQYMTVYLKCDDRKCCSCPRTKVEVFFPGRRIPALIPIKLTATGPVAMELVKDINKKEIVFPDIFARIVTEKELVPVELKEKYGDLVPYDAYLPTQQDHVQKRICPNCKKYHASIKSLTIHKKACKKIGTKSRKVGKKAPKKTPVTVDRVTDELEAEGEDTTGETFAEENDHLDDEIEVNASFEDHNDDMEYANIEEVQVGATVSVSAGGIFESILNLKEWMKQPWTSENDM